METILKEEYKEDIFRSSEDLLGNQLEIEIKGLTVDRSFEDRDVYIRIDNLDPIWLRGEEAIELGQMLIKHGTNALKANMLNHQHIHMVRRLDTYLKENRIEKVVMTVIDEHPANYGPGFKAYQVKPVWIKGMEPMYDEDFSFETIIYWSPFEDDYKQQLSYWGGDKVKFIGYDREAELEAFHKNMNEQEEQ